MKSKAVLGKLNLLLIALPSLILFFSHYSQFTVSFGNWAEELEREVFLKMGLSNFHSPAEGVLPVLVMNTVMSVALLKNMVRSVLQVMGANGSSPNLEEDPSNEEYSPMSENAKERRVSVTQFKSLCHSRSSVGRSENACSAGSSGTGTGWCSSMDCCVCLCRFEAEEEVSELSCKHFFHKGYWEKWFDNKHSSCPLCRSIL